MSKINNSEKIIVKKSGIHNSGVFAAKDIKKGEKIIEYIGRKITKLESDEVYEKDLEFSKSNPEEQGGVYIFTLNKDYDIDGNIPENTARLINHSCNPNAETEIIDGRVWILALKDIKKGEEITYDYGFDLNDYKNHICKCSAKNCIGYIVQEDLRIKLRKKLVKKRIKDKRDKRKFVK